VPGVAQVPCPAQQVKAGTSGSQLNPSFAQAWLPPASPLKQGSRQLEPRQLDRSLAAAAFDGMLAVQLWAHPVELQVAMHCAAAAQPGSCSQVSAVASHRCATHCAQ